MRTEQANIVSLVHGSIVQVSGRQDQSWRGTQHSLPRVRLLQTCTTGESHDPYASSSFQGVGTI